MFPTHVSPTLADERGRRLRAEAEAERLRVGPSRRRALAAAMRRTANRLDGGPLARRPRASGLTTA